MPPLPIAIGTFPLLAEKKEASASSIHNSQFTIHNSQFTIHNSQFTIHNSQFTIHNSPLTTHNSQFTIHNSPLTTHNSQLPSHPVTVVFFHRKNPHKYISIEAYFENVRKHLPAEIKSVVAESRFYSQGILKRVYNVLEAACRQGDVNHITGDVHFLALLLKKKKLF